LGSQSGAAKYKIEMIIRSKSGKLIADFSKKKEQAEVLFKSSTNFEVEYFEESPQGTFSIILKEQ
jgi:hypothetical protein